jgi:hypothetical protein
LSSVALADAETHVITGRVVELVDGGIIVQSGKKRLDIVTPYATKYTGKPKVGDTVRVYYTTGDHARFDPDGEATKIEVIAAGGSKK